MTLHHLLQILGAGLLALIAAGLVAWLVALLQAAQDAGDPHH
jgi:hypothetical protein